MGETFSARERDEKFVQKVFVGEPGKWRQLERPNCRLRDAVNIVVNGVELDDVSWIHLARNGDQWWAPLKTVMNLRFP